MRKRYLIYDPYCGDINRYYTKWGAFRAARKHFQACAPKHGGFCDIFIEGPTKVWDLEKKLKGIKA